MEQMTELTKKVLEFLVARYIKMGILDNESAFKLNF